MRGHKARYVVADDAAFIRAVTNEALRIAEYPTDVPCPKCGADLDDGECEECERVAPLDFDT